MKCSHKNAQPMQDTKYREGTKNKTEKIVDENKKYRYAQKPLGLHLLKTQKKRKWLLGHNFKRRYPKKKSKRMLLMPSYKRKHHFVLIKNFYPCRYLCWCKYFNGNSTFSSPSICQVPTHVTDLGKNSKELGLKCTFWISFEKKMMD